MTDRISKIGSAAFVWLVVAGVVDMTIDLLARLRTEVAVVAATLVVVAALRSHREWPFEETL